MANITIRTAYIGPPIPIRCYDWAAWDDNLGADSSPIGRGETEQAAIKDFMEIMEERNAY